MRYTLIRRGLFFGVLIALFTVAFPGTSQADPLVLRGFDLFATDTQGTRINVPTVGLPLFRGVPLGSFDFGAGPVNTGNADTIVERLGDASPASPTISLEIIALQFRSLDPITFGGGTNFLFITLQSIRGGPVSTGLMTINFGPEGSPHGTFDSTLDVFFDIRVGALDGMIVFSGMKTLTAVDVPWSHFPRPDAILIPDVIFLLNGQNQLNDFFPIGLVMHSSPDNSTHTVVTATPEPTTLALLVTGIAGVAARVYRSRKAKSC